MVAGEDADRPPVEEDLGAVAHLVDLEHGLRGGLDLGAVEHESVVLAEQVGARKAIVPGPPPEPVEHVPERERLGEVRGQDRRRP